MLEIITEATAKIFTNKMLEYLATIKGHILKDTLKTVRMRRYFSLLVHTFSFKHT